MPADPFDTIVPLLPASCRAWGRGWCAATAGMLEAWAAKPGNVHPAAAFADLSHAELVAAALAIAPLAAVPDDRCASPRGQQRHDRVERVCGHHPCGVRGS